MHRFTRLRPHSPAYLITCHTYRREPLFTEHRDLIRQAIMPKPQAVPFRLLAWHIAPSQIQIVIDPCGRSVAEIVDNLKAWFGWHFRIRTGRLGPIWEPKFIKESISDPSDLQERVIAVRREEPAIAPIPA